MPMGDLPLARFAAVGGVTLLGQSLREGPVAGEAAQRRCECGGVAGRDEQCALVVGEQLPGRRRVGRDERRPAGERLERLVRNHSPRLVGGAEDPQSSAGLVQLAGKLVVLDPGDPLDVRRARLQQRVELAGANQPDPEFRRLARGGKDRLEAVERDQLADEQERERLLRRPAGPKEPLLGADEAVLDPLRRQAGEPREVGSVGPRVRNREIGGPKRTSVDRGQRPRGRGAGAEPAAV